MSNGDRNEKTYPSDLPDEEWERITARIPAAKSGGRPRTLGMRAGLKAIFSGTKGGRQWRRLPTDVPQGQRVSQSWRPWKREGGWGRIHETRRARVRAQEAQHTPPTAGWPRASRATPPRGEGRSAGVTTASKCRAACAAALSRLLACSASWESRRPRWPLTLGHATAASGCAAPARHGATWGEMARIVVRHGPSGCKNTPIEQYFGQFCLRSSRMSPPLLRLCYLRQPKREEHHATAPKCT